MLPPRSSLACLLAFPLTLAQRGRTRRGAGRNPRDALEDTPSLKLGRGGTGKLHTESRHIIISKKKKILKKYSKNFFFPRVEPQTCETCGGGPFIRIPETSQPTLVTTHANCISAARATTALKDRVVEIKIYCKVEG